MARLQAVDRLVGNDAFAGINEGIRRLYGIQQQRNLILAATNDGSINNKVWRINGSNLLKLSIVSPELAP